MLIKVCAKCGQIFNLPEPSDNAYDIRVHLRMNPTHEVKVQQFDMHPRSR